MAAIKTGSTVDTSDLLRFARRMAVAADPSMDREFIAALKTAVLPVVETAKQLSSWSSRIPGTIKTGGGKTRITVKAGGPNAPHAKAFEHHGVPGVFRHPVFGNRKVWVTQPARPFLVPALQKNVDNIGRECVAGVKTVLREAGFR